MILVADSGSTKCDWIVFDQKEQFEFATMGFNPMFHNSDFVIQQIQKASDLIDLAPQITHAYYYGAACSGGSRNAIIYKALKSIFENAEIHVNHDLAGAAIATCKRKQGIACILGTGSNSAYFDGQKTHEEVPALGYILGDEGSGAYFGKKLLTDFLYKQLPENFEQKFIDATQVNKESIFENVYMKPHANVYLASFMRFLTDQKDHPYVKDLIYTGLSAFIDLHIWQYPNHKSLPVHFVGSVCYFFKDILLKACQTHRIQIGTIVRKPIYNLVEHHKLDHYQLV